MTNSRMNSPMQLRRIALALVASAVAAGASVAGEATLARGRSVDTPDNHPPRPFQLEQSTPTAWRLDSSNWQRAQGLLPEPVLRRVRDGGYWYRVAPLDGSEFRANYPENFWRDSEANTGRYAIDPETCGLIDTRTQRVANHLDGFPFPAIELATPFAACQAMWNAHAADALGHGHGSTITINGLDSQGEYKRIKVRQHEAHYLSGQIENPAGLRHAALISPFESPDADDVGGLSTQINDWSPHTKTLLYVPALRRVRNADASDLSRAVAGLPIFHDVLALFTVKIESFSWRLVGEGEVLAPTVATTPLSLTAVSQTRHEVDKPPRLSAAYETPASEGLSWLIVDGMRMTPRPVWIIEGRSKDPRYQHGRVISYIDREMYRIHWKLVYDREGNYFYNAMFGYYWVRNIDASVAAVMPAFFVGVDDSKNRAVLGRMEAGFVQSHFPCRYFDLSSQGGCWPW